MTMVNQVQVGNYSINLLDKLGKGNYGVVHKGKHKVTGKVVAAKCCELEDESKGQIAVAEIKFLSTVRHPHIVELLDFQYRNNCIWIVMECCKHGDLNTYFRSSYPDSQTMLNIMYQCASGVMFMHGKHPPVVHRDIKPHNILVTDIEASTKPVAKLADLGIAQTTSRESLAETYIYKTKHGTPGFMGPEFFMENVEEYSRSSDIFSLGLVYLSMAIYNPADGKAVLSPLTGQHKMAIGQIMAFAVEHDVPQKPYEDQIKYESEYAQLKDLIKSMIKVETKDRIKIAEVLKTLAKFGGSSPCVIPNESAEEGSSGSLPCTIPNESPKEGSSEEVELSKKIICRAPVENEDVVTDPSKVSTGKDFSKINPALSGDKNVIPESTPTSEMNPRATSRRRDDFLREGEDVRLTDSDLIRIDEYGHSIRVGEKVRVTTDEDRAAILQVDYGNWGPNMRMYLGQDGIVTGVKKNVKVKFDNGHSHLFHPDLLIRTGEVLYNDQELAILLDEEATDAVKERFRRYDVVRINTSDPEKFKVIQDQSLTKFDLRMLDTIGSQGMVNHVQSSTEVFLEFPSKRERGWFLHPNLLSVVDMSHHQIEPGDFVVVIAEKKLITKFRALFVSWNDRQIDYLGHAGTVEEVRAQNEVVVSMGRGSYSWHPMLLRIWMKGADYVALAMAKRG